MLKRARVKELAGNKPTMAAPSVLAFLPLLLLAAFSAASTSAHRIPNPFPPIIPLHLQALRQQQQQQRVSSSDAKLVTAAAADAGTNSTAQPFTTHYFPQELDHFTFTPNASMVFRQKYLVNDTFWRRPSGGNGTAGAGPLFVYTGNEGDIEWFATNTGFMFDIAPKFGALLVFIEVPYQLVTMVAYLATTTSVVILDESASMNIFSSSLLNCWSSV